MGKRLFVLCAIGAIGLGAATVAYPNPLILRGACKVAEWALGGIVGGYAYDALKGQGGRAEAAEPERTFRAPQMARICETDVGSCKLTRPGPEGAGCYCSDECGRRVYGSAVPE
jgi:hypothetical protein